jgi:hypothetical protein
MRKAQQEKKEREREREKRKRYLYTHINKKNNEQPVTNMSLLNSLLNQKQKNAKQLHISTTDNNNNNMDTTSTAHMYYNPLSYKQLLSPLTIISSSQRRNTDKSDFSFAKRFNYFDVDATTLPQHDLTAVTTTTTTAATNPWSPAIGSEYAFKKSQPLNIINGHQRAITKTSEANSTSTPTPALFTFSDP